MNENGRINKEATNKLKKKMIKNKKQYHQKEEKETKIKITQIK